MSQRLHRPSRRPRRPRTTLPRTTMARPTLRLRTGLGLLIFVFSIFAARLVQIQGIEAHAYAELADSYDVATEVTLSAPRGDVVDRFGAPLAQTVDAEMLFADPTRTADDAPQIAAVIARHSDASYLDLVRSLRKPGTQFSYLARKVSPLAADAVMADLAEQDLAGVYRDPDPLFCFCAGDVAANVVGFLGAGEDANGVLARAGVEFSFDDELEGTDGHATYVLDGQGTRIPLADSSVQEPVPGADIALTIDQDLQFFAQRRIEQAVADTGSLSGAAVVLDPRTSEILALADYPSFDSSAPDEAAAADIGSRAIEQVYEPGSVQKALTAAAVIDSGTVTPKTKMTLPAQLVRDGETITDWFGHGRLQMTFAGVIAQSSNIGIAMAAEQLEPEDLHGYLSDFGLGQPTHLGLPGETRGLLPDPDTWQPIRFATIAYGQGLSVNAVQLATAISAVANDGRYVEPSVVKGYVGDDGEITPVRAPQSRQVVSPKAAHGVTHMMELVTGPEGTAPLAAIEGYRVAGKTGTAQRVDPDGGGYAAGGFTISFAGFAPADDPAVVTYVVLQKPSTDDGGGSGAGPAFRDITSFALQKYGVPPTRGRAPELRLTW